MKKEILDEISKKIDAITPEEITAWKEEYDKKHPPPPHGWVDIESHLPQVYAMDYFSKGYSTFKVKDIDGKEFETKVCDGMMWLYEVARPLKITHWFNTNN